jgi:hypothetical protein
MRTGMAPMRAMDYRIVTGRPTESGEKGGSRTLDPGIMRPIVN